MLTLLWPQLNGLKVILGSSKGLRVDYEIKDRYLELVSFAQIIISGSSPDVLTVFLSDHIGQTVD